jgi:hypothetical protein
MYLGLRAAISGLMGMFSEQAALKLKQVFEQLFTSPEKGEDHRIATEKAKQEGTKVNPEDKEEADKIWA